MYGVSVLFFVLPLRFNHEKAPALKEGAGASVFLSPIPSMLGFSFRFEPEKVKNKVYLMTSISKLM